MEKTRTKEFEFKSKSNPNNSYTVLLYDDGTTSCNCRGWTIKRSNKERGCRHTKEVEAANPVNGTPKKIKTEKAKPTKKPSGGFQDVEPMRASKAEKEELEKMLVDPYRIAEEKLDGGRYILHLLAGGNRLFSRLISKVDNKRIERTDNVPHLRDLEHKLTGTDLDGEIITGENCKSNDVTRIMGSHPQRAVEAQEKVGFVKYKVFDILRHRGVDLRDKTYRERYAILESVIEDLGSEYLLTPRRVEKHKKQFFENIIAGGGEGIILKDLNSKYIEGGRTDAWVKMKREKNWNAICTGFTKGKNAFAGTFGAIKLSMYKNGRLIEVGQCSGMTLKIRTDVHNNRKKYLGQVLEVTGQEFTAKLRIRHPRFKQWRMDVNPKDCKVEEESKSI